MANILVVDDEKAIRELLREGLKMIRHEVDVADNGVSGLKQFHRREYDLVIIDLIMPEKDGIEFIGALKKNILMPKFLPFPVGPG